MPRNEHGRSVTYESPEGAKEMYAVSVRWKEEYVSVRHYPEKNDQEFLHEDEVAGVYPKEKKIPREKVYSVDEI